MTALAGNFQPLAWAQGWIRSSRRAASSTYTSGKHGYLGSLTLSVNGAAQPLVSGTALNALCATIPGADANGGVILRARRSAVTVQFAAGTSKTLGVTSITYGTTTAILIQQGTDGGGAVTNTAAQMATLIRTELDQFLACKATGTGAGLTATAAATAIPFIELLGAASQEYDATAGAITLTGCDAFDVGAFALLPDAAAVPVLNSIGTLIDDQTVSASSDPLAFSGPVVLIDDRGFYYVDLNEVK